MQATADLRSQFRAQLREKLSSIADKKEKTTRRVDLLTWAQKYLPHYFDKPSNKMHREMSLALTDAGYAHSTKILCEGPRGSAKSTTFTLFYVMWAICEEREQYIILAADTTDQAKKYLEAIAAELTENAAIARDYPEACGVGPTWNKNELETRNGVQVEAMGAGKKIRGRRKKQHRPSCIIVDDPEGDDAAFSIIKRQRIRDWFFKAVLKAGNMRTNFFVVGTRIHQDCLTATISRLAGWQCKMYKSIMQWPERMELWSEWELTYCDQANLKRLEQAKAFYDRHESLMNRTADVLWPESESLYQLMCMRAEGHASFESEKQNNPIDPSKCEWAPELFEGDIWFEEWPTGTAIKTIALDPSKGKMDKPGDYSAIVKVAVDSNNIIYVDADLARRDVMKIVDDFVAHCRWHNPDLAGVETNMFQHLIAAEIIRRGQQEGLLMPLVPLENMVHKVVRIRRIGPYLNMRAIRFKKRSPGVNLLLRQMQEFPNSDHDDGPDALEMCIRLAVQMQGVEKANKDLEGQMQTVEIG